MKKEKISDFTLRITQSNKTQLLLVVYEMTLEYLNEALECYQEEQLDQFVEATKKARACVQELMGALDMNYAISLDLMQIYVYVNKLLIQSALKRQPQDYEAIKRMIHNLWSAFWEIEKQDTSAPLMANTQQVYAGLTYGKKTLSESYANQNTNRGFCV